MTNWTTFPTAGERVTTWVYNPTRGWLDKKIYAGETDTTQDYEYTSAGRLWKRHWERTADTTFTYNNAGELQLIDFSDATPDVAYGYDRRGRQVTVVQGGITTSIHLDHAGLVLGESYSGGTLNGLRLTNVYDARFRRVTQAAIQGTTLLSTNAFVYDAASRLQDVSDGTNSATYTYLANSPMVGQIAFKSSGTLRMISTRQYDFLFDDIGNRTSTKAGGDANGANLRSATYASTITNTYSSRTVPGGFEVLGLANPLANVTVNGSPADYRRGEYFEEALSVVNSSVPVWQPVNVTAVNGGSSSNWPAGSVFVPRTPESFTYDKDGNLTTDGRWTYTWDGENRLTRLVANTTVGPQQRIDLAYDWQGRRIGKTVWPNTGGTGTPLLNNRFLYDGWNLVAELNATNNAVIRRYQWGLDLSGSEQGAGGVGGLLSVRDAGTGTRAFVAFDGNGNVAALVNATDGTIAASYEYGPFGELLRATGPMAKANPFRFSTKYQDDETDFLYYGHRFYSPSMGRWPSRDPIEERGGRNLYAFVRNQPTRLVDRLGKQDCDPCGENVSDPLSKTLSDISYYFHNWPADRQVTACKWIIGLGPLGLQGAKGAWSIKELAYGGAGRDDSGLDVGSCRGNATVTFQSDCYFASAVNYAMWGRIMRLCHDSAQQDPETFEGISPDSWSLLSAEALMTAWLLANDGIIPGHEMWNQKAAFTRYGYLGVSPGWSAPKDCGTPSRTVRRHQFSWWWHPVVWWDEWPPDQRW